MPYNVKVLCNDNDSPHIKTTDTTMALRADNTQGNQDREKQREICHRLSNTRITRDVMSHQPILRDCYIFEIY